MGKHKDTGRFTKFEGLEVSKSMLGRYKHGSISMEAFYKHLYKKNQDFFEKHYIAERTFLNHTIREPQGVGTTKIRVGKELVGKRKAKQNLKELMASGAVKSKSEIFFSALEKGADKRSKKWRELQSRAGTSNLADVFKYNRDTGAWEYGNITIRTRFTKNNNGKTPDEFYEVEYA